MLTSLSWKLFWLCLYSWSKQINALNTYDLFFYLYLKGMPFELPYKKQIFSLKYFYVQPYCVCTDNNFRLSLCDWQDFNSYHFSTTIPSNLIPPYWSCPHLYCKSASLVGVGPSSTVKWECSQHQHVQESFKIISLPWAPLVDNHQSDRSTQRLARLIPLDWLWGRGEAGIDKPRKVSLCHASFPPDGHGSLSEPLLHPHQGGIVWLEEEMTAIFHQRLRHARVCLFTLWDDIMKKITICTFSMVKVVMSSTIKGYGGLKPQITVLF